MLRAGADGAQTKVDRLRKKAKRLREADRIMPQVAFRARAAIGALITAEETRRASGARAAKPGFGTLPELHTATGVGGEGRADVPFAPPQPSTRKDRDQPPAAPARPDDYGYASLPRETPSSDRSSGQTGAEQASPPLKPEGADGEPDEAPAVKRSRWAAARASLGDEGEGYHTKDAGTDDDGDRAGDDAFDPEDDDLTGERDEEQN